MKPYSVLEYGDAMWDSHVGYFEDKSVVLYTCDLPV